MIRNLLLVYHIFKKMFSKEIRTKENNLEFSQIKNTVYIIYVGNSKKFSAFGGMTVYKSARYSTKSH